MQTTGLIAVLAVTVALMVGIACDGSNPSERPESNVSSTAPALSPTPTPTGAAVSVPSSATTFAGTSVPALSPTTTSAATAVPEPSPTTSSIDGATWILESIYGQPPIAGTYATLTVNGPRFGGFDGCNFFGGRHESGKPIINPDGDISVPPFGGTAVGCMNPPGILDQADLYMEAMYEPAKARVVDGPSAYSRPFGRGRAGFRQATAISRATHGFSGHQLADRGRRRDLRCRNYDPFVLDSRAATGTTACRDYTVGYTASNGRMRMPSKGMSGSTEACSRLVLQSRLWSRGLKASPVMTLHGTGLMAPSPP